MYRRKRTSYILLLSFLLLFFVYSSTSFSATWQGQWGAGGSWNTGTDQNPDSIKWRIVNKKNDNDDHPAKNWTNEENSVATFAIGTLTRYGEWFAKLGLYKPKEGHATQGKLENVALQPDITADITIRWEDDEFFRDWNSVPPGDPNYNANLDLSKKTAWWFGPANDASDPVIQTVGTSNPDFPINEIYLNVDANPEAPGKQDWFVDDTPYADEEFEFVEEKRMVGGNEIVIKKLVARKGSKAEGKKDLYTTIKHEFGHALGETHPPRPIDDNGNPYDPGYLEPMFPGRLGARAKEEEFDVSFETRRHLFASDAIQTGYNTNWFIFAAISLMLAGGYLILRRKRKFG